MPLEVIFEPTTIGKLRFMLIIESSMKSMNQMGFTDYDTDDVKGIFFDTNIYLLLLTVFVTSFHVSYSLMTLIFVIIHIELFRFDRYCSTS